jgi:hypothetical protein
MTIREMITTALGFVREHTPESSTRLCAVICCVTGCVCALLTELFAFKHADHAGTITALVGVTSALIGAGCVAIINRSQKTAESIAANSGDAG